MPASQDAVSQTETCSAQQPGKLHPLWSLFDHTSTCIAQLDLDLRLIGSSDGFADLLGLPVEELLGVVILDVMRTNAKDVLTRRLLSLARGERSRFTDRIATSTGAGRTNAELTGIAVPNAAGRVHSVVVLLEPESDATPRSTDATKPLTRMEALVLEGVASGMSTVELATKLFLSRGGVEYYVSALMKNLQAANRSELVSKAYSAELFSAGTWPPQVIDHFIE